MAISQTLLNRTLNQFKRALRFTNVAARDEFKTAVNPDLTDENLEWVRTHIQACLDARGGEVSARARAARLGELYLELNATGRERFLNLIATDYDVELDAVETLVEKWRNAQDKTTRWGVQRQLRRALEPRRLNLLRQFNALDSGVKFLVDLRADLRDFARGHKPMTALDNDLRELLTSWFDVGFLDLRRITWDTPAALLEKLIEYEAVHAIQSWDDLKNRLAEDRRCYAFFHPRMPDEPLIFVQVALVKGMSGNVHELLDLTAPLGDAANANTAIFYSISNCQAGLAGVSFGNFLIKRVAHELARDLPNVKTFATLSPIPGFCGWLAEQLATNAKHIAGGETPPVIHDLTGERSWAKALPVVLDRDDWFAQADVETALKPILTQACADYLLSAKRAKSGRALDPVAHFHLSNGARIERLNWLGDHSHEGLQRSAGMMVNYLYRLDEVDQNHESYTGDGLVKASNTMLKSIKP